MSMKAFCIGVDNATGQYREGEALQISERTLESLPDTMPLMFGSTEMEKLDEEASAAPAKGKKTGTVDEFVEVNKSNFLNFATQVQEIKTPDMTIFPVGKTTGGFPLASAKTRLVEFMKVLAIAHECVIEGTGDKKFYQGPSPDEIELVEFAKKMGFEAKDIDKNSVSVSYKASLIEDQESSSPNDVSDDDCIMKKYEVIRRFNFTSTRKRMSALVRDPADKRIKLLMKGADTIVLARLDQAQA
jgi:magnesium-transporting ATPase (P-type)